MRLFTQNGYLMLGNVLDRNGQNKIQFSKSAKPCVARLGKINQRGGKRAQSLHTKHLQNISVRSSFSITKFPDCVILKQARIQDRRQI